MRNLVLPNLFKSFSALVARIEASDEDVPDQLLADLDSAYGEALVTPVETVLCLQAKLNIMCDHHEGGTVPAADVAIIGRDLDALIEAHRNPAAVPVPMAANCQTCPLMSAAVLNAA